jgi:hypothetical protein
MRFLYCLEDGEKVIRSQPKNILFLFSAIVWRKVQALPVCAQPGVKPVCKNFPFPAQT